MDGSLVRRSFVAIARDVISVRMVRSRTVKNLYLFEVKCQKDKKRNASLLPVYPNRTSSHESEVRVNTARDVAPR